MDYKNAGVDTEKAQNYIKSLKDSIVSTHKNARYGKVVDNFGGFAGIFNPADSLKGQQLVAATDGVGTKIEIARRFKSFEGLGFDLLAMCINDLYCVGATPLFFLDYISCGKLDDSWYFPVMKSISSACEKTGVALLGGETAEHPGVMGADEFDLAGFIVGMVDSNNVMPKLPEIIEGDVLYAFSSSGLHSNGFSLVRKILEKIEAEKNSKFLSQVNDEKWIIENLLAPTRIYDFLPELIKKVQVKGIAHITGGGIFENLPRILPDDLMADIYEPRPYRQDVYNFIEEFVSLKDMYHAFNMGIGIILVADSSQENSIKEYGGQAIGTVKKSSDGKKVILKGIET